MPSPPIRAEARKIRTEDPIMRVTSFVALLACLPVAAQAQTAADSTAIRDAALDYVDGWYQGDAARMERAVHPELAKRIVQTNERGRSQVMQMSALTLIESTRAGGGRDTPTDQQTRDVRILDISGNSASVRAEMSGWIDYMHMARWNGQWKIVNVLWELKPRLAGENRR
jgi:hypothetical protein